MGSPHRVMIRKRKQTLCMISRNRSEPLIDSGGRIHEIQAILLRDATAAGIDLQDKPTACTIPYNQVAIGQYWMLSLSSDPSLHQAYNTYSVLLTMLGNWHQNNPGLNPSIMPSA